MRFRGGLSDWPIPKLRDRRTFARTRPWTDRTATREASLGPTRGYAVICVGGAESPARAIFCLPDAGRIDSKLTVVAGTGVAWRRRPGLTPLTWTVAKCLSGQWTPSNPGVGKMRRKVRLVVSSIFVALLAMTPLAVAQQKTVAACRAEWRANEEANKAAGITERAFVAQCRSGAAPAQTTAAPAGPPSPAPAVAAPSPGQKTVAACRAEWRANRAANKVAGVTERAFVAQCRSGAAPAQTTAAPTAPPSPAPTAAPVARGPAAPTSPAPSRQSSLTPNQLSANEFATETQAKARCPADTVVWANLPSRIYHFSDTRYYGQTKHGAYMCERDAVAAGMRAAKNETHP